MDKLRMHTSDFTEENIQKIADTFPNSVTESRDEKGRVRKYIDFDMLRQELSDSIVEGPQERYHLDWPGKREALLAANAPIAKTLRPCPEESVDFDTTENLFIEGDNLDALKLMQETYLGKVKMIYIDPPYNTGNDFVYRDDFAENSEEFLKRSNQKDEEGNRLVANNQYNGRFHSDWLSMMYPRLRLARNLLRDDGVIFLSIDDNEVANLRRICDEIFGEENLLAKLVWQNKEGGGGSDSKNFRIKHEYVIVYARQIQSVDILGTPVSNLDRYKKKDSHSEIRGKYYLQKLNQASIQYSESLDYFITAPDGTKISPAQGGKRACWRWSKEKLRWGIKNDFIEIKRDKKGQWQVYTKQYLYCDNSGNRIERSNPPLVSYL